MIRKYSRDYSCSSLVAAPPPLATNTRTVVVYPFARLVLLYDERYCKGILRIVWSRPEG